MKISASQSKHLGWITARDNEVYICEAAREKGATKNKILEEFSLLSERALTELLKQNDINLQTGRPRINGSGKIKPKTNAERLEEIQWALIEERLETPGA